MQPYKVLLIKRISDGENMFKGDKFLFPNSHEIEYLSSINTIDDEVYVYFESGKVASSTYPNALNGGNYFERIKKIH